MLTILLASSVVQIYGDASSCPSSQITDIWTLLHSDEPKFVPGIHEPDKDWWRLLREGGFGTQLLDVQIAHLRGQQEVAFFPYLQSHGFLAQLPGVTRLASQQTVKLRGDDLAARLQGELPDNVTHRSEYCFITIITCCYCT